MKIKIGSNNSTAMIFNLHIFSRLNQYLKVVRKLTTNQIMAIVKMVIGKNQLAKSSAEKGNRNVVKFKKWKGEVAERSKARGC